jgi:hypothetical protein
LIRLVACVALAGGCLVDVDYGGTRFRCAESQECPEGLECAGQVCVPIGTAVDADTGPTRLELEVSARLPAALAEAPIMVALTAARIDYARAGDGSDLRFVDAGGAALAHEIERWDPEGTSIVWVKLPVLESGARLAMIYGAGAGATERPAEVWSAYEMVFHLADGVESRAGLDATAINGAGFGAARIGGGAAFDGVDDYLALGQDLPLMRASSEYATSFWINGPAAGGPVFEITNGTGDATRLFVNTLDSFPGVGVRSVDGPATSTFFRSITAVAADEWHWIAVTVDLVGQTAVIYADGVELDRSAMFVGDTPATPDTNATTAVLGADDDLGQFFGGQLDELRGADVAFDGDWIAAQYLSMTDALLAYDPETP